MPREFSFGPATSITRGPRGGTLIGRYAGRAAGVLEALRGGTVGVFWIDPSDTGTFRPF